MKRVVYIFAAFAAMTAWGAPHFVTPAMLDRRNGLTDEQYELLWAQGKNPSISKAAARDWVFRAGRYQCVTNWLDICGKTNNFAALSFDLQDKNFRLVATNASLVAINDRLRVAVDKWMTESATFSNAYMIVSGQLAAASAKLQAELASLKEEKADLEAKIADSKYILLRTWLKAKLAVVEQRIAMIEALTGGAQ